MRAARRRMRDPSYQMIYWMGYEMKKLIRADRIGQIPLFELFDWAAFFEEMANERKRVDARSKLILKGD